MRETRIRFKAMGIGVTGEPTGRYYAQYKICGLWVNFWEYIDYDSRSTFSKANAQRIINDYQTLFADPGQTEFRSAPVVGKPKPSCAWPDFKASPTIYNYVPVVRPYSNSSGVDTKPWPVLPDEGAPNYKELYLAERKKTVELEKKLAEAAQDTEMLDWLIENSGKHTILKDTTGWYMFNETTGTFVTRHNDEARAAIAVTMRIQKSTCGTEDL